MILTDTSGQNIRINDGMLFRSNGGVIQWFPVNTTTDTFMQQQQVTGWYVGSPATKNTDYDGISQGSHTCYTLFEYTIGTVDVFETSTNATYTYLTSFEIGYDAGVNYQTTSGSGSLFPELDPSDDSGSSDQPTDDSGSSDEPVIQCDNLVPDAPSSIVFPVMGSVNGGSEEVNWSDIISLDGSSINKWDYYIDSSFSYSLSCTSDDINNVNGFYITNMGGDQIFGDNTCWTITNVQTTKVGEDGMYTFISSFTVTYDQSDAVSDLT